MHHHASSCIIMQHHASSYIMHHPGIIMQYTMQHHALFVHHPCITMFMYLGKIDHSFSYFLILNCPCVYFSCIWDFSFFPFVFALGPALPKNHPGFFSCRNQVQKSHKPFGNCQNRLRRRCPGCLRPRQTSMAHLLWELWFGIAMRQSSRRVHWPDASPK